MKRIPVMIVTLLVALATVTAIGLGAVVANRDDDPRGRMRPGMMEPGSRSAPGWGDADAWGSMMGPMAMMGPMTGWAAAASEPDYLVEMVAHHQEAVEAARELARSDRPEMRDLGQAVIRTQTAQIEQMQAWLSDWYPEASTTDYRPMMRDLSGLSGDDLDRGFLQDMIGHHMVAVMMSQHQLWQGTDHDEVADLARSIRDEQHIEMAQMQRWLSQWFGIDWRPQMHQVPW